MKSTGNASEKIMKTRLPAAICLGWALAGFLFAAEWWDKKPFQEWSPKEATRMLDNSPWGKIHTVTISNPAYTGERSFQTIGSGDLEREKRNLFHLHFLTAKPVRMAVARNLLLGSNGKMQPAELQNFVDQPNEQSIVVGLTLSSEPPGASSLNGYMAALLKLTTPVLASNTTLATNTGKRVFLSRYDPPGKDGLGAKYYFPRNLPDGEPLVTSADKEIRFETMITLIEGYTITGEKLGVENSREDRVWMQFDLRKMIFQGKLEI